MQNLLVPQAAFGIFFFCFACRPRGDCRNLKPTASYSTPSKNCVWSVMKYFGNFGMTPCRLSAGNIRFRHAVRAAIFASPARLRGQWNYLGIQMQFSGLMWRFTIICFWSDSEILFLAIPLQESHTLVFLYIAILLFLHKL